MTFSDNSTSLSRDLLSAGRYYLGSRISLTIIATIGLSVGAYFNWKWLVAAGIAPLIIGVLPCAAMCALGLCMGGKKNKSAESNGESVASSQPSKITDKATRKMDKERC